eukprot:15543-Heterococcus_DN1.PRE.1
MQAAATCDQRATCAYLHAEGCLGDELTMYEAAIAKHWDTVRWLHEHGCPWDFEHMCLTAAELDVLSAMLTLAGAYDHLAAAQWLRQRGSEWPPVLHFDGTDWSGDVLEWARAEGCDSPLH